MTAPRKAQRDWNGKWACTYDRVSIQGGWGFSQCSKTAKHDPDPDGNPTRCGIHCEAAKEKRRAKSEARYKAHVAKVYRRRELHALNAEAREILATIAEGHNDPRALAADWVKRFKEASE